MVADYFERMIRANDPEAFDRIQDQKVAQFAENQTDLNRQLLENMERRDLEAAIERWRLQGAPAGTTDPITGIEKAVSKGIELRTYWFMVLGLIGLVAVLVGAAAMVRKVAG